MSDKKLTFESALSELEAILAKMNSGEVTLDESVELYAKAADLLAKSNGMLNEAKIKIEEIGQRIEQAEAPDDEL